MDCLLSVCDYIVEFYPTTQTLPDGTKVEVPYCCPCLSTGPFVPSCEIQFSSKKLGVSVCISTCLIKVDRFVQVMATRPRSDIYINLPALEKLDAMLIVRSDSNCYSIDLAWHDLSQT